MKWNPQSHNELTPASPRLVRLYILEKLCYWVDYQENRFRGQVGESSGWRRGASEILAVPLSLEIE